MEAITILSVNYLSAKFIRFQEWCLRKITSENTRLQWLIVNNSPDDSELPILRQIPNALIVPSDVRIRYSHDKISPLVSPRSTQHGRALNELLPLVKTSFGLIMDPDCFVLCHNWDLLMLSFMKMHEITVLGAPYHPSRRLKFGQKFPTVTFMLFQSGQFQALNIDFCPGLYPRFDSYLYRNSLLRRLKHGTWKDTGWRTKVKCEHQGLRTHCFDTPVLRPMQNRSDLRWLAAQIVPERYLTWPRKLFERPDEGLLSEAEIFAAPGGERYEEYYFKGKQVLCHLRGVSQLNKVFDGEEAQFWARRIAAKLGLNYDKFVDEINQ